MRAESFCPGFEAKNSKMYYCSMCHFENCEVAEDEA